ncbi:MAG: oligoendopeptidase F [Polyangia bacterium]|jgi:oligoendopeptidase F
MQSFALPLAALSLAAAPSAPSGQAAAKEIDRSRIDTKYKWKLDELYVSDKAWAKAKAALAKKVSGFERHKGHLGDGAKALADALSEMGALQNELQRIAVYAHARSDENTRLAAPRAMRAEADSLSVQLDTVTAWLRPELLTLPEATIRTALAKEKRLREWAFYLQDVLRWKPHTLAAEEERIVAMAGELSIAPSTVYGVLKDADLPYPTVTLSTGEDVRLDPAGFARTRASRDRADRVKVFQAFFGALKTFERTTGATLSAQLKAHIFDRDVHHFPSTLEAALFHDNIPADIYGQLIEDVNANLPTLHRYLKLRQRMLGLAELGYEDLYAPLVSEVDRHYSVEDAVAMTLAAVAPLGPEYGKKLAHGLQSGWTDFLPSTGKRAGAYSTGVYGVHPYQLLNFNGQWDDVSTLAHEAGHSMHTLLAGESQPFATSSYATFVAEIASTLNENLLVHRALAEARNDRERLALLGERLESLRTTLFRQTMFAEFELAIHERAEKGEALTGEALSAAYLRLVRRYYGHDEGICTVAELYGDEWSFVPHFYYDFYVYQYATSLIASTALTKAILDQQARGTTVARDRYLALLSAGGSDFPVTLLARAGVDLTTSAPFLAAMQEMNALMTQIESILSTAPAK